MATAWLNKVQLVYLPAHTSHKTQPLDRSIFSALKNYFRQATKALASFIVSAAVNKRRFRYCHRDIFKLGMSARNLISGFRDTGIWPLDSSKVLQDPEAVLESQAFPIRPKTPSPEPRAEF
jgi:4-hydroxybenzoate polyprenyltransferase